MPDIPQAFATGRVDAMITSPSTGANTKAWDFVKHYYHAQAWLPKNIVVVNKKAFRKLDKAVQAAVLAAAKAAEERGWAASVKETETQMAVLKKNGMDVEDPSPELKAGLEKIGATMSAEWAKTAGPDGAAILAAYRK